MRYALRFIAARTSYVEAATEAEARDHFENETVDLWDGAVASRLDAVTGDDDPGFWPDAPLWGALLAQGGDWNVDAINTLDERGTS